MQPEEMTCTLLPEKNGAPLVDVVSLSASRCAVPIRADLKYATVKNFIGRPVDGYEKGVINFALMTPRAAGQLCLVQNHLIENYKYGLLIYDAYRPKRAVRDFLFWSRQRPASEYELIRKEKHYPNIEKDQLFALGYLAEDSGHCYGNTVDLVLVDLVKGVKLPMGTRYDFMDERSHYSADKNQIGELEYNNRNILKEAMQAFGFHPYEKEYWHFSHGGIDGREVSQPIDVEISEKLRGLACGRLGYYIDPESGLIRGIPFHDSPNVEKRPDLGDISLLVIHDTEIVADENRPYTESIVHYMFTHQYDRLKKEYPKEYDAIYPEGTRDASAHLVICRNGDIHQYVSFKNAAWHAGVSEFMGREKCNAFSIGIELEGYANRMDFLYTEKQYAALVGVTLSIMEIWPKITLDRITGHEDIARPVGRKTDPGQTFDWEKYKNAVQKSLSVIPARHPEYKA